MSADVSTVHVQLAERSYEIRIVRGGLTELPSLLPVWLECSPYRAGASRRALLVTDRNARQHADVVHSGLIAAGWAVD